MKMKGWGTRWEFEKTKEVAVFTVDGKMDERKAAVIEELVGVLKEFSIPMNVVDGNLEHHEDFPFLQALFDNSIKDGRIDFDKFEGELRESRKGGRLPYGLIILVNKNRYEFYHSPQETKPAIYGVGVIDGVVILRCANREAVRHEFGHMLGLGVHHEGCVMDYSCTSIAFCNECKREIEGMWRDEIHQGKKK